MMSKERHCRTQEKLSECCEANAVQSNKAWPEWVRKATEERGGSQAFKYIRKAGQDEQDDPEEDEFPQAGSRAIEKCWSCGSALG